MHWETLEKQFPNQIETIFFFKQYHFLPHVYVFHESLITLYSKQFSIFQLKF
jgi:hypothetical protein